MVAKFSHCVREYIEHNYRGGLIGISDLADYCHVIEGELYKTLFDMQSQGELKIIKRYFCPEFHKVSVNDSSKSYCQECDLVYLNEQLEVAVYIKPLSAKVLR